MERLKIDVLGVSQIRWIEQGDYWARNCRVIFSDDERKIAGVCLILNKKFGNKINTIKNYNERIISIRIKSEPSDTFINKP